MRRFVTLVIVIAPLSLPSAHDGDGHLLHPAATQEATSPKSVPVRTDELPRGRVVERVATLGDASQTYALYLPSRYVRERAWPVLYCFDPMGRGRVPVERFREAAEKYGWIVVGSNNSRNGPLRPSFEATQAMWTDVQARLSIDSRRVYTAGFSGGARLAVRVNYLCQNCLAGVIASGAGFPPDITPTSVLRFALFGAAGTDDFNFPEMKQLDAQLDKLSFPHRLAVFDGTHMWMPSELCARAVEWMELQAIRTQRRERDETLIAELWRSGSERAAADEAAGRAYEAYLGYLSLAEDFDGLREVAGAREKTARLGALKEVRRALDEEAGEIRRQRRLYEELFALATAPVVPDNDVVDPTRFRRRVADLRKLARAETDTSERRVARRTLNELFANFYEHAGNLRDRGEGASQIVVDLELASELAPDNPRVLFELASAYARNKEKKKALATLKRAVENGFNDADAIAADQPLATLREEAAYKEILDRIQRKP